MSRRRPKLPPRTIACKVVIIIMNEREEDRRISSKSKINNCGGYATNKGLWRREAGRGKRKCEKSERTAVRSS
jgi:hypothetical protein